VQKTNSVITTITQYLLLFSRNSIVSVSSAVVTLVYLASRMCRTGTWKCR